MLAGSNLPATLQHCICACRGPRLERAYCWIKVLTWKYVHLQLSSSSLHLDRCWCNVVRGKIAGMCPIDRPAQMYVDVKDFTRRFQKHLCYVQCCFYTKWFRPLHFAGFGVGAEELAGHRCFSNAWGLPIWQQQEHPRTMHVHMLGLFELFGKLFCNEILMEAVLTRHIL